MYTKSLSEFVNKAIILGFLIVLVAAGYRIFPLFVAPSDQDQHRNSEMSSNSSSAQQQTNNYSGGAYAQSIINSDHPNTKVENRRLYALMTERQMIINRNTPRLLNPMLGLQDVNYRHNSRTIDYNFEVSPELNINAISNLGDSLQNRYCSDREYALMRDNGIKVAWHYWNKQGILLKRIESHQCW